MQQSSSWFMFVKWQLHPLPDGNGIAAIQQASQNECEQIKIRKLHKIMYVRCESGTEKIARGTTSDENRMHNFRLTLDFVAMPSSPYQLLACACVRVRQCSPRQNKVNNDEINKNEINTDMKRMRRL